MKSQTERSDTKIVVDCSTLAYAAYYSYGHLAYNREPTGVIFGFLSKVLLIAEKFDTNQFAFCWDSKTPLHRENDYDGYKEKRRSKQKEMSKEEIAAFMSIREQREELRVDVLPRLGFKNSFIADGFEADDLLAVYSRKLSKRFPVIMVTTDADMYQCLDCCDIFNPQTKKTFTKEQLKKDFCISPDLWAMAKAIGGCDGDGVSGIVGVADPKKNTSKGLKYLNGKLTKGVIFDRIESEDGQATIKKNLPIVTTPYREEDLPRMILRRDQFAVGKFISVFEQYGFNSFLKKIDKWKESFL